MLSYLCHPLPHSGNSFRIRLRIDAAGMGGISACKEAEALIDLTGVYMKTDQSVADKMKNNDFLVDFQKYVVCECERMGVPAYYGSDAHSLASIGKCAEYYRALYE